MLTQTGTIKYKVLALALVVVLLTCWVSNPRQVKAAVDDSIPSIEYQSTNLSPVQVKAYLDAVAVPSLMLILGIVGFICVTYCVLRNVDIGIDYSGQSFFEKCQTVGQYMYDQLSAAVGTAADQSKQYLANVFYSVYLSVLLANGGLNPTPSDDPEPSSEPQPTVQPTQVPQYGVWGPNMSPFNVIRIGEFFGALSLWISSSFVQDSPNVTTKGAELLKLVQSEPVYSDPEAGYDTFAGFRSLTKYSYPIEFSRFLGDTTNFYHNLVSAGNGYYYDDRLSYLDVHDGLGYFSQYYRASDDLTYSTYIFKTISSYSFNDLGGSFNAVAILQFSPSNGLGGNNPQHYTLKFYEISDDGKILIRPVPVTVNNWVSVYSENPNKPYTGILYHGPYTGINYRAWNVTPTLNTNLVGKLLISQEPFNQEEWSIRLPANTFGTGYLDPNDIINYLVSLRLRNIGIMECDDFSGTQPTSSEDSRIHWRREMANIYDKFPVRTQNQDTYRRPVDDTVRVDIPNSQTVLDPDSEKTPQQQTQRQQMEDALEQGKTDGVADILLGTDPTVDYKREPAFEPNSEPDPEPTTDNNKAIGRLGIPGLDDIWKYVRYTFNTLGGFITYCGQCLDAVTVGEGGLSWFFYGAFIMFVCGGFISKLLL